MGNKILSEEEIKRAIKAFLKHPDRVNGATSDDIITVIKWIEDIKLKMLLNKTLLKEIYLGNMVLDLNKDNEVVISTSTTLNSVEDPEIEKFLSGDLDDYTLEKEDD